MTDNEKINEYVSVKKSDEKHFDSYVEMLKTLPQLDREIDEILSELKRGRLS